MDETRQNQRQAATLPPYARLPVNRCNLPAVILGSLTYQTHPVALQLDGVNELHAVLFRELDRLQERQERANLFKQHMRTAFLLDTPEEAGFNLTAGRRGRDKADYLRMLRGWLFDPDGKEGAVLKSWVESRFGLLPRNHGGPLGDYSSERYQAYLHARAQGLYNTNALEAQFDLLYTYCQYELQRQYPEQTHLWLFRGINRIEDHEIIDHPDRRHYTLLLNNLNSFTSNRDRADEFGDYILSAEIPLAKLLFIPGLLPNTLKGEEEYLVIGGVYAVTLSSY